MGIDHGSSEIAVPQQLLNCADIIISLEQMTGKRVAESMGGDSLREFRPPDGLVKSQLDVCFMKMVPPQLLRIRHVGQRLLREKPLPDEILTG